MAVGHDEAPPIREEPRPERLDAVDRPVPLQADGDGAVGLPDLPARLVDAVAQGPRFRVVESVRAEDQADARPVLADDALADGSLSLDRHEARAHLAQLRVERADLAPAGRLGEALPQLLLATARLLDVVLEGLAVRLGPSALALDAAHEGLPLGLRRAERPLQ